MELDRLKTIRLHGFSKFIHALVMIITYPLRHIFKTLLFVVALAVIMAAVPLIKGVSLKDIPDWYIKKYQSAEITLPQVSDEPENKIERINQLAEVSAPKVISKQPQGVELPEPEGRRAFKAADTENAPKKQYKIMKINKAQPINRAGAEIVAPTVAVDDYAAPSFKENKSQPVFAKAEPKEYYRKDTSLPLVYEETPKQISGKTFVFNGNELSVGDTYIILYGIYTNPEKYNPDKAYQYLKELADGKNLRCMIVAYTYNNIATGVCFLNGISINQNMVDAGFADNVAL